MFSKKTKHRILFFVLIFGFSFQSFRHIHQSEKYKLQAFFIYNFTKYINWPENKKIEFAIAVCKDSEMLPYLKELQSKKTIQGKSISIKVIDFKVDKVIPDCDIIYFESKNLKEVRLALKAKADIILLDNMNLEQLRVAVRKIGGQAEVEVSGGMTLEKARQVAQLGVDYSSVGRLTHSAPALDLSLEFLSNQ